MLFTGLAYVGPYWEKLRPLSAEYGPRPYSRPRAQFLPIRTSQLVNNIYVFKCGGEGM